MSSCSCIINGTEETKKMINTLSGTSAQSLLDLCTQMVATHLDIVESFIGLPSLIGEKIFFVGSQTDRFICDVEYSTQAVRLFTDAYDEEILSSLNVSGEHLGLNYCLEQILLFTGLTQLDLTNCGLGDDHEMLAQVQHLHRLEVLSLKGNAVTNVGVQKMTAPYRMFQRGPACLVKLDLRDNMASRQCLKYLANFKSLLTVMFSEPNIEDRKGISTVTHHSKQFGSWTLMEEEVLDIDIHTEGWAKVLIDRWMMEARLKSMKSKPVSRTGMFSIRKCPQIETSNLSSSTCVVGNQSYHHFTAKRVYLSGVKTDLGNGTAEEVLEEATGHTEEEEFEDLYKIYTENEKICHDQLSLLQQLECCEMKAFSKTSQSDSGGSATNNTRMQGIDFLNFAKGRKQNNEKDIVEKKSKLVAEGLTKKKRKRSICDFMIRKSVPENKKLNRIETLSGLPCTTPLPVFHKNVRDGIDSDSSRSVDCGNPVTNNLPSITSSSKINCPSTLNIKHVNNSRKRKRIVIKKSHNVDTALSSGNDLNEYASTSVNENVNNDLLTLVKENLPNRKRFKSTFLQYLD